jgi:hypothetical protein
VSPALPLAALGLWMAGATAAIYGRKGLAWLCFGLGLALLAYGAWASQ